DAAFVSSRPVQQRIEANGGWPLGAAAFVGDDPAAGAEITYYQRTRHLFGKLKIEVLDAQGNVVDELPASTRRGLNRVVWSMHLRPPHVPPAVQLAQAGTQGPRVLPGTYTVRIEKNGKSYTTTLTVGLDKRVNWTAADRQSQYDAAMKVETLFNDESTLFARIAGLRQQIADRSKGRPATDAVAQRLSQFDAKLDGLRKQIVATTEGGAITGEERLREHTDQLYAAITSWEGPPAGYQLANIAALRGQLGEVEAAFTRLTSSELPAVNKVLQSHGAQSLNVPVTVAFDDDEEWDAGGSRAAGRFDPDAVRDREIPANL